MGRNGVKVIIRTRPTASFATSQIQIDPDENTVTVFSNGQLSGSPTRHDSAGFSTSDNRSPGREPSSSSSSSATSSAAPSNRKDCWRFKFHQVLHNSSQDKVYEAIARDIVHGAVVDGVNGTILAYGQTGAGKSFTMIGDTRNYQHRGIAPRAIAQVYEELENRIEIAYTIKVSYMEIYNDRIYDLLENHTTAVHAALNGTNSGDLVVVEDARGTYVRGLTQVEASSEQDALDQLFNGELQRTVAEHQLNKRSNRSHCIFTLHISQKSRAGGNEKVTHSKLHLVDLAGSERLKKTMDDTSSTTSSSGTSTIKKESMYINQSLSFLEQCIVALSAKDPRHIPYRQTKLTNVLKDSLGGNSNTLMFACIWGESKYLEETISTLKLAQRMMKVQNQVASIVETDPAILLRKYEKQIKELKHELVMHDALVERTGVVYDEHTPEQKHQLMEMVRKYVDATTRDQEDALLKLSSVHEIRELFRQFKILFKNVESEIGSGGAGGGGVASGPLRGHSAGSNGSRTQSSNGSRADIHGGGGGASGHGGGGGAGGGGRGLDGHHGEDLVGEDDPHSTGFGLGVASSAARPSTIDAQRKAKASGGRGGEDHDGGRSRHRSPSPTRSPPKGDDKATRQHFSGGPGSGNNRDGGGGGEGGEGGGEETNSEDARFKNDAFQFYKSTGPGKKIFQSLQEEKDKLGDCKHKVKSISSRVNAVMLQIDDAKQKLQEKRAQRPPGSLAVSPTKKASSSSGAKMSSEEMVVDEEEFILMKAEREAKRDYRSLFEDLKDARAELSFTTRSVELLRMRLVREFEDWFEEEGVHLAAAAKSEDDDEGGYSRGGRGGGGGRGFHAMLFAGKEDKLDDGEKFDQMEVDRVRAQDPDSLAFFQAQKKMRHQAAAMGGGAAAQSKSLRKSKRGV